MHNRPAGPVNEVQASYQTKKQRRKNSLYTSSAGIQYSPEKVLGIGATAEIRYLRTTNKSDATSLVVKRMKKNTFKDNGASEENYLKAAYPERMHDIKNFFVDADDHVFRLVMPFFGDKTLYDILVQKCGWRSLNHRYAFFVKAIQELKRLHDKRITHGDTHANNIMFDENGGCAFIDGNYYATSNLHFYANAVVMDILIFKNRAFSLFDYKIVSYSSCMEKNPVENHIYLRSNDKNDALEYAIVDIHGKLRKNKITVTELQPYLSAESIQQFTTILSSFNFMVTDCQPFLPAILELTSSRGETIRDKSTYFSENFSKDFWECNNLADLTRIFSAEMVKNQERISALIKTIKTELFQGVNAALASACSEETRNMLEHLKSQLADLNTDHLDGSSSYQTTDQLTSQLMHLLYQAERISSHEAWTIRLFSKKTAPAYLAAKPHYDKIRETLRLDLPLLPEAPISCRNILYNRLPANCKTHANYKQEVSMTARRII